MMRPSKIRREIKRLLDLLSQSDIALHINPVIERRERQGLTRVTWGSPQNASRELFRGDFGTISDYCAWLESHAYSAVLYDGAILQFSYDFSGNELVGHRLAYYPCPFDIDENLLRTEPFLDVISLYRNEDNSFIHLRSPLRFDYDLANQHEGHPTAHLTLIRSNCRWAVIAPMSPGHFIRFLFRHFYTELWDMHKFVREWPQHNSKRTIRSEEEELLHVAFKDKVVELTRASTRTGFSAGALYPAG